MALHSAHAALLPRNTSRASTGDTSLQKGQRLMTASQSFLQPHRLQLFSRHPQQMAWVQHPKCVNVRQHASESQKPLAQM